MIPGISKATLVLSSIAPYSQSRAHDEPKLQGERPEDHDIRTWRHKMHVADIGGEKRVIVPPHSLHQAIAAAAKYSKRQIPGQGKATWTAKFTSGIMIDGEVDLGVDPTSVDCVQIYANADGIRGSGKRVYRRFPIIPSWRATVSIYVLDPIITEEIFREMVEIAGIFIGIGRFRPEKGGSNGRFKIDSLTWQDGRQADLKVAA